MAIWRSLCRTMDPEFRLKLWIAFSKGSIEWTKPARANRAGQAWAFPSSNTSSKATVAKYGLKVRLVRDVPFASLFRRDHAICNSRFCKKTLKSSAHLYSAGLEIVL